MRAEIIERVAFRAGAGLCVTMAPVAPHNKPPVVRLLLYTRVIYFKKAELSKYEHMLKYQGSCATRSW